MSDGRIVILSGGVGGAKFALGAYKILPANTLSVITNIADDFVHLGLSISPDLDTLLYTLAGLNNEELGWGRRDETWTFMNALRSLGGEDWFQLGDGDLALHVERTERLKRGETLTAITRHVARSWNITADILPVSDDLIRTMVETDQGELSFQDYFVGRRCQPILRRLRYDGAAEAKRAAAVENALLNEKNRAIIIAPSNPYLSIDPILTVPGIRERIRQSGAPVVAVSPIVGAAAIKGPLAKIMAELDKEVTPVTIAAHYGTLLDGFVLDRTDEHLKGEIAIPTLSTNTIMSTLDDKKALAQDVIRFADTLATTRAPKGVA